ncbi:Major facilitator superfamily [Kalmanozyma brasiliensis GHG001]|uniref:Major facilitator superfamily (MFS) profile domain-containing protein n=1 Tax=Kalmanozyma brasiliensis (strain GHG001) TaxID=1365824 RepID=V5EKW9_KALBG|nr:Major facilitator superfamily [Kalmanozyma brasiliensis GHG001]EST05600.1 Major facilitator superfamily [Kalmanozyma brasiliensis GHG001]
MTSSSRSSSQHRPHQPPSYWGAEQQPLTLQAPSASRPQSRNNSSHSLHASSSSTSHTRLGSSGLPSATSSSDADKKQFPASSSASASLHSSNDHEEHGDLPGPLPTTHTLQPLSSRLSRADSRSKAQRSDAVNSQQPNTGRPRSASNRSVSYLDAIKKPSDLHRASSRVSSIHRCEDPPFPASALGLTLTKSEDPDAIYIDWPADDPENPFNWPTLRKWILVSVCFLFTACTAFNGCGYPSASYQASVDLQTTQLVYLVGNAVFLFAVAITPLMLAPLSEVYGRSPIYLTAVGFFTVLYIPQALAKNITTIIVVRWFQGMAASVGNSLVAGSVSDLFHANERGFPMSLYSISVYVAQGVSPFLSSMTVNRASWRIMFWWQGGLALLTYALMYLVLKETRGPVLLSRRAKKLTAETGRLHKCRADDERQSFLIMVRVSLFRPMQYLVLEPVVLSFTLWIGFLWGVLFISLEAVPIVFSGYGWNSEQQHMALLTIAVGGFIGYFANIHQEKLYARKARKCGGKPPPEARLYYAAAGGILAPIGLFIFAWTGRQGISPVAPLIGLVVTFASLFPIYLAQSFLRNTFAAFFPLFSQTMYVQLTPKYASTLLACIAALLGVVPFVLLKYGHRIRKHSRAAMALEREEQEAAEFLAHEGEKQRRSEARRAARAARIAAANGQGGLVDEEKIVDREERKEDGDTSSDGSDTPAVEPKGRRDCDDCNNFKRMPPTSIL